MAIGAPLSIKYRPKKLSDVIGQPIVVKAFQNSFKYKTLHHAYILAGNGVVFENSKVTCPSHSGSNGVTFTIIPQRA